MRTVKGQIRTMKEDLDSRLLEIIPGTHPILAWLPRHSAASFVRYHIGEDGRTPHERLKGKRFKRDVAEFWRVCLVPETQVTRSDWSRGNME